MHHQTSRYIGFLAFGAAGLLLAVLPATAKPKLTSIQTAEINNSGSTNTFGYDIGVSSDGSSAYSAGSALLSKRHFNSTKAIPAAQIKKLFADLNAAMPLTDLPVRHGMRSASFGTQTYITYKGQKSPDLTFASDPRTAALKTDIDSITKALHVGNVPRRPIVLNQSNKPINSEKFKERF